MYLIFMDKVRFRKAEQDYGGKRTVYSLAILPADGVVLYFGNGSAKRNCFEDYWKPFTLGAGPAPGCCVSLESNAQNRLRDVLRDRLPQQEDGPIVLKERAWAIKAKTT